MRVARFLALILVLLPASVGANGPASDPGETADCVERATQRVQVYYETVRDLSAHFEQETRAVAFGNQPQQTFARSGSVIFAKPGRMRWSYEQPEPSLVVSDGETLWVYDPAAGEAQHLPLGARFLSGASIQFLLGRGDLLREFRVEIANCEENPLALTLLPREDAPYERLELRADRETGEVLETTIVDLVGNATRVAFSQVRTNVDPDPALFRFVPEPGVRVLELPPQP